MILRTMSKLAASVTGRPGLMYALPVAATAGLVLAVALSGPRATAEPTVAEAKTAFSKEQKDDIGKVVREYLLANPEVLLEVQGELEKRMQAAQAEQLKSAITDNAEVLFRRTNAPIAGNPNGDVTVVEFFDYNCGFCKRGFQDIAKAIQADDKIKVVLKEFPIFGKASEDAARAALAAKKQGKYWELHSALLQTEGRVDGARALKEAEKLGLDVAKLKADMQAEDITSEIMTVRDLATKMGINGTPHFLVGDRAIPGAPEDLSQQILANAAEIRKSGGCQVC